MIVVNASTLSPVNMARIPSKAQKRFQKMALFSLKFITLSVAVADNVKFQYDQFKSKEAFINQEKFLKINFKTGRLGSFSYQFVVINAHFLDFWKVMKLIFIATQQTIETLKKASVRKPLRQPNRANKIMLLKLHLLLRHSRRRRCLALWFRGKIEEWM